MRTIDWDSPDFGNHVTESVTASWLDAEPVQP